jgi:two-component system phosphate regulon sensor histidine kinase PhoR
LEQMRVDFIANASHELRTPLASLIGFIDTLLGPAAEDTPAQKRFLGIMQVQAARMRRLIDNLLSLSRIQMTEHERPRGRVALAEVAAHVAESFEPLVRARGRALELDLAENLPPVQGDADQIAQIVQNLLDNALKYACSRIVLSVRPVDAGGVWPAASGLVLAVSDDGPGIAAHHVPRLTERFYRAEEGNGGTTGSGLGLAIVKHIVGRHAGRLQIGSSEGKGSCFSVWLPVAPVTKL